MDSVAVRANDVRSIEEKHPSDDCIVLDLTIRSEPRHTKTATIVRFVAVSVSVNQRTLIQILAKPCARQQKGAFMKTNSPIPFPVLSVLKTLIARPSFPTGGAQ
jgi:hypothetical protein